MGKHTVETKRRISHGLTYHHAKRRASESVTPSDVRALARNGAPTPPAMRPLLAAAAQEAEALIAALGGPERVSPQRRVVIDDVARLGLLVRAQFTLYVQTGDPEAASRLGTLAAIRRASLVAVGLDEHREEHDLASYLVEREKARSDAPDVSPDAQPASASDRPACANAAREGDA